MRVLRDIKFFRKWRCLNKNAVFFKEQRSFKEISRARPTYLSRVIYEFILYKYQALVTDICMIDQSPVKDICMKYQAPDKDICMKYHAPVKDMCMKYPSPVKDICMKYQVPVKDI